MKKITLNYWIYIGLSFIIVMFTLWLIEDTTMFEILMFLGVCFVIGMVLGAIFSKKD